MHNEAFDFLEKAYESKAIDLPDIRMIPEMNELRETLVDFQRAEVFVV